MPSWQSLSAPWHNFETRYSLALCADVRCGQRSGLLLYIVAGAPLYPFHSVPNPVCPDSVPVKLQTLLVFAEPCSRFLYMWAQCQGIDSHFGSALKCVEPARPLKASTVARAVCFSTEGGPPACDGKKRSLYIQNCVIFPTPKGSFRIYITDNPCQFSKWSWKERLKQITFQHAISCSSVRMKLPHKHHCVACWVSSCWTNQSFWDCQAAEQYLHSTGDQCLLL